ncbi:polyketide synthase dehydratase domain-containing protein, partial [Micromonospora sp. NPDC048935]|uniref:polyketide synthase dehydratase domain-containing protein n=1 Tax=Micromonospora sp. NPDC048935 TaxID=3364262 RepID=UPI0037235151
MFPSARRVELPTYAFQRHRYWLDGTWTGQGMLDAPTRLADSDGVVFTGRLSTGRLPWIADHRVAGAVLLPGTAFVELAVRAADEVGCALVEELMLEAPLVFPGAGTIEVQVTAGAPDASGRRALAVHSRAADATGWTRHATGVLADDDPTAPEPLPWPPADATPLDLTEVRATLVARGYEYGPAFDGLQAAWRQDNVWYAEVSLPAGLPADGYVLHPALLDTALQPLVLDMTGRARLPFAWQRVSVRSTGATTLRARLVHGEEGVFSVEVADGNGQPVLTAESVVMRPLPEQLGSATPLLEVVPVVVGVPVVGGVSVGVWPVVGGVVPDVVV